MVGSGGFFICDFLFGICWVIVPWFLEIIVGLKLLTAFQSPAEGDVIRVFEFTAKGQSSG